MAKWIIGIIIVALLGGALWFSGILGNGTMAPSSTATTTPEAATSTPQAVAQPENGMAATNNASDAALAQDTAAVDAQMKALASDNSKVDSSVSDKQTAQSY